MSENCKNNHEAGGVSGDFTCKFFGRTFKDIRMMVLNTCIKKPTRSGCLSPTR